MGKRKELLDRVKAKLYPRSVGDLADPEFIIRSYIIGAYAPAEPPIPIDAMVGCVGSCFASEIATALQNQGKRVALLGVSERFNTAFAVRAFIENGLEGKPFPQGFLESSATLHAETFDNLRKCRAFIITLGLSVCWFDIATGNMVLDVRDGSGADGLMAALSTHTMRQTTPAENVQQIEAIIACIRRANPEVPIVFSLSPVPLFLSFTEHPSIPSNTVSKAVLRAALHDVTSRNRQGVYYWPSYEIVEWLGKYIRLLWGQGGNDLRHLEASVVEEIMRRFVELYFPNAHPG